MKAVESMGYPVLFMRQSGEPSERGPAIDANFGEITWHIPNGSRHPLQISVMP